MPCGACTGGVGGGNNAPTITSVAPSQVMTSVATSITLYVYGTNFSTNSVIDVNGAPINTSFQSSTEL
jgi:hypothetical protein